MFKWNWKEVDILISTPVTRSFFCCAGYVTLKIHDHHVQLYTSES